ncbi:MAG: hypothetical protein J7483_07230 [Novosphingobium sp.]|nr:hypothetical protein [Novosphingobium sp.]
MSDISGTYEIVINSPMGDQKATLTIKVDGDKFTGTSVGAQGSADLSGDVSGNTLAWKQAITVPMPLTLDFSATVEGDAIQGKMDTGSFGAFPFSGKKTG